MNVASNDEIVPPFFVIHAFWHVVGLVGFRACNRVACEARDVQRATPV